MSSEINVAVLGSTGYVGYELVKMLIKHPKVNINFLGCDSKINNTIYDLQDFYLLIMTINLINLILFLSFLRTFHET